MAGQSFRQAPRTAYWKGKRHKVFVSIVAPFLVVQCLFLGLQAYIYGSAYGSPSKVHNLRTLAVDFDQGIVGRSLRAAYEDLEGVGMLGVEWSTPSAYPNPSAIYQKVYDGAFWAGIYISYEASDRLNAAIVSNDTARSYNASKAIGVIYNQARYPDFADAYVSANLQALVLASRLAYNRLNGTEAIAGIPSQNTASLAAVLNPIEATVENVKPLGNGARVFYNTVGQVFTILLQFFFLMAFNTLLADWHLDSRLPIKHHVGLRIIVSTAYTFVGSLAVAANIYAFRGDTEFSGGQLVLLWMAFWLEMHVLFLVLEIATTFLQMPFLPLFVVTFIIVNVTSSVLPFELSPGFYKWGYALPCHEIYQIEITIMSGGANDSLDVALPVLFAWWIFCLPLAFVALYWRCNRASQADKEVQEAMQAYTEEQGTAEHAHRQSVGAELLRLATRNAQEAANGTYGLGFPAPGPFSSSRHKETISRRQSRVEDQNDRNMRMEASA